MFRKILKGLWILQVVSNKGKDPKLGRGFVMAHRFNPWNPLSYVALILVIVFGIVLFGLVGFWRELDGKNPFKWD